MSKRNLTVADLLRDAEHYKALKFDNEYVDAPAFSDPIWAKVSSLRCSCSPFHNGCNDIYFTVPVWPGMTATWDIDIDKKDPEMGVKLAAIKKATPKALHPELEKWAREGIANAQGDIVRLEEHVVFARRYVAGMAALLVPTVSP